MGHGSGHSGTIKNPGAFATPKQLQLALWAFVAAGAVCTYLAFKADTPRAWSVFLVNHFYFLCLGLGGVFFAAIQWITGAMWSAPIRRVSEAFTAYLPFVVLTTVVIFVGLHSIYHWTHTDVVQADPILKGKAGYLNPTFFMIRNVIALAIWWFFASQLVKNSVAQDQSGSLQYTDKNKVLSCIFIILFAITFTMASFDQIMSLDPHWFSTMFGVYCFSGLFYSNLAATALLTIYLRRKGLLKDIVNDNHLHDLGKFMFAFTVFWAYIGFSQFMLIWYSNLPEETGYYLTRIQNGWFYVSVFLLLGKFVVPFFILMPRNIKRKEQTLWSVGWFMLVAQWIDVLWMVQPEFFKEGPRGFGVLDAGMTAGFIGVFGLLVSRFLAKNNVVAIGDPKLAESVFHHHQ